MFFPEAVIIYDAEAIFAVRDILKANIEKRPLDESHINQILNDEKYTIYRLLKKYYLH